jgi:hypothetical protein
LPTLGLPMMAILGGECTSERSFAAMIRRAIRFESMLLHFYAALGAFPPTEKPKGLPKVLCAVVSIVFLEESPTPLN